MGGEGGTFVELERKLQSMTEEELRSINKEGREKLRQALTELTRRREKRRKKQVPGKVSEKQTGASRLQLGKRREPTQQSDRRQTSFPSHTEQGETNEKYVENLTKNLVDPENIDDRGERCGNLKR